MKKRVEICLAVIFLMGILGLAEKGFDLQGAPFAQASGEQKAPQLKMTLAKSVLFEKPQLFDEDLESNKTNELLGKKITAEKSFACKSGVTELETGLLEIVGETPMREMIPFIAQRENKVAAFLVGIAKKESSFGLASPFKDGSTCFNYWGYKGQGARGTAMGYSCFASAQEAVEVVGNRLAVLIEKDRNTPVRMVDTWKCGRSCAGDPGAPSWVSTVALYFDKIVKMEG